MQQFLVIQCTQNVKFTTVVKFLFLELRPHSITSSSSCKIKARKIILDFLMIPKSEIDIGIKMSFLQVESGLVLVGVYIVEN